MSILAAPAVAAADDDRQGERRQPVQELIRTHLVYPQEAKELQVTFGSTIDNGRAARAFTVPVALEYGVTGTWQVELEWESLRRVSSTGEATIDAGEPAIGTQYSFMNLFGSRLHTALGVEIPFGSGAVEPYTAVAFDLTSSGVQVFGDLVLEIAGASEDGEAEREREWSAGALIPFETVTLATELNVRGEGFSLRRAEDVYVVPSITVRPARRWELGVGVPIGLTRDSNRFGLAIHAIYER